MTEHGFRVNEALARACDAADQVGDILIETDGAGAVVSADPVRIVVASKVTPAAPKAEAKPAPRAEAKAGSKAAVREATKANAAGRAGAEAKVADAIAKAQAAAAAKPAPKAEAKPEAEAVGPLEPVSVPLGFLRGALACAAKPDDKREYLTGVHVSVRAGMMRVCGTDGARMFVGSLRLPAGATAPDWTEAGVIIPAEGLRARLALFQADAEDGDDTRVRVAFAHAGPVVELQDACESIRFRIPPIEGAFPDYDRVVADAAEALNERQLDAVEAPSFRGHYMKGIGDLAAAIGAKNVSMFARQEGPAVITFPDVDGALLILMPLTEANVLPAATALILGPGLKGTLAALKANLTRTETAIRAMIAGPDRDTAEHKAAILRNKITAILAAVPALPAPKAKAEASTVH